MCMNCIFAKVVDNFSTKLHKVRLLNETLLVQWLPKQHLHREYDLKK